MHVERPACGVSTTDLSPPRTTATCCARARIDSPAKPAQGRSIDRPTNQSINQSIDQPIASPSNPHPSPHPPRASHPLHYSYLISSLTHRMRAIPPLRSNPSITANTSSRHSLPHSPDAGDLVAGVDHRGRLALRPRQHNVHKVGRRRHRLDLLEIVAHHGSLVGSGLAWLGLAWCVVCA